MSLITENIKEYESFLISKDINEEQLRALKNNFKDFLTFKEIGKRDHIITARHYIGIACLSNILHIKIDPKVDDADFYSMLKFLDSDYVKFIDEISKDISLETNYLVDVFVQKFLSEAERIVKYSIRKNYYSRISLRDTPRGKILIKRTFSNPSYLQGKIFCEYDSLTMDTIENRIIKYALYLLIKLAEKKHHFRIKLLLDALENIRFQRITINDIDAIRYNHLTQHYKTIHFYCRMIIGNFSFGYQLGKYSGYCWMINSWDIFEKFLLKIFNMYAPKKYETNKKSLESWDEAKNLPDIEVSHGRKIVLLGDAKYKMQHSTGDRHQASSYLRYASASKKRIFSKPNRNVVLIYPRTPQNEVDLKHLDELPPKFGRVYQHTIDLSKIDEVKHPNYLRKWVLHIFKELNISP